MRGICSIHRVSAVIVALFALALAPFAAADAWPTWRHDSGRTGFTTENLPLEKINAEWTFTPKNAPMPAWPDPVREVNLLDFDYAFQVAVADGLVFFGSSADCTVYAISQKSGEIAWTYTTDGPIRFAPAFAQGKLLVASDDGNLYCFNAKDGALLWKKLIGPTADKIIGNGRMISRWPLRSGLAVADGNVYFSAGMWPLEKTFMCAYKIDDGSQVWKIEPPDFGPQGYLALNSKFIYLPAGRAPMWVMNRVGGGAHAIHPLGRSFPMAREDVVITGPMTQGGNDNLPVPGSQFGPRATSIIAWVPDMSRVTCGPFGERSVAAFSSDATIYAAGRGKVSAHDFVLRQKWVTDGPKNAYALIVANNTIIVGGDNVVEFHSTTNGSKLTSVAVNGQARGLAVSDGKLYVSLDTGAIVCFGTSGTRLAPAPAVTKSIQADDDAQKLAKQLLADSNTSKGYALLIGIDDVPFAAELARQSELKIYAVDSNEQTVKTARQQLGAAGLLGTRITVLQMNTDAKLALPDYFANLIVMKKAIAGAGKTPPPAEIGRLLRPCGGTAYRIDIPVGPAGWIDSANIQKSVLVKGTLKAVRGKLPGAADWTQEYANSGNTANSGDELVKWPLRMLWFGEPGPARMMQRHLRGTAPVTINGRMFILGQHSIMSVDAYNGTEYWSWELPSIQRRVVDILGGCMASDADTLYVSTSDICIPIDPASGKLNHAAYTLPVSPKQANVKVDGNNTIITIDPENTATVRVAGGKINVLLETKDASIANLDPKNNPGRGDSFEVFIDTRSADKRDGLYGPGVHHLTAVPTAPNAPTTVAVPVDPGVKNFLVGIIRNYSNDGKSLVKRAYAGASPASYRVANFTISVGGKAAADPILAKLPAGNYLWGYLGVDSNTIVGSAVEYRDTPQTLQFGWDLSSEGQDFTGPQVPEVLRSVGLSAEARYLFALDKTTGRVLWTYIADNAIPHNAIAIDNGRVYLIDRPASGSDAAQRRGEAAPAAQAPKLVVLNLKTGQVLAQKKDDIADYVTLRVGRGVLLAGNTAGMTAFNTANLAKTWSVASGQPLHHCGAYTREPVITKNWVYDEPAALDPRTGKPRPGWNWGGGNFSGCGTVSASEHMLFFRHGTPNLVDASGSTPEYHHLVGTRPGCYINMIPACGLLLMPEASSGCGCPYNFQTTVALSPAP